MKTSVKIIATGAFCLVLCSPAFDQIYKWRDKDGNLVISNAPPPAGVKWEMKKTEEVRPDRRSTERNSSKPAGKRPISDIKVIMYMTDWCPVCKKARVFLKDLGVNLVEYDVDKDPQKNAEWLRKVGNKKGVPTIDIEGTVLQGLYGEKILAAIEEKRAS